MKTRNLILFILIISSLTFVSFKYNNHNLIKSYSSKTPSIEGTYVLVSRKLPDGTTMKPPSVSGIQTFTKDARNFNIMWTDKNGKHSSYSVYSNYKLTDKDYTETIHFGIMNDEISGKGLSYTTDQTKTVPIKSEEGKLEIQFPFDLPAVTFENNKMIATAKGMFTDYWEKIK